MSHGSCLQAHKVLAKSKFTHTQTNKEDMKRTHHNWSDNSKHSLWLIGRKKLQIVVFLGEYILISFCSLFDRDPDFFSPDPDFSFELSGRSDFISYLFFFPPEFVRLAGMASTNREFEHIGLWLQTLLQWGADPDLEPYPSEPIICHCQSSIFLKKLGTQPICHYVHEVWFFRLCAKIKIYSY